MSTMTARYRALDVALKRMDLLCRRAEDLPPDATKAERLALVAEISLAVAAMRVSRDEIRGRLARSRRCRPAVTAYGRAANILQTRR